MGQKVNPTGFRLGINKTWKSKWFVDPREYANTLHEDLRLRKYLMDFPETKGADICDLEIIRHPQRITIVISTSRPGVIIGSRGANIEKISARLQHLVGKKIQIKIKEIKRPEINAQLIAMNVARQLKNRASFRKVVKSAIMNAIKSGAQGARIKINGRIGGAEMSRQEQHMEGRVPLHTLRAAIDYGHEVAITSFGAIGVKVWVFAGEVFGMDTKEDAGLLLKKREQRRERAPAPRSK